MHSYTRLLFVLPIYFLFSGCFLLKKEPSGVYHYTNTNEKDRMVNISVRFSRNKKFTIFGIYKHTNLRDSTFEYSRYAAFGDWYKKGDYLILNSNFSYKHMPSFGSKPEDAAYLSKWPWNFEEAVIKIEQDTFLIYKNIGIFSLKRNILLSR